MDSELWTSRLAAAKQQYSLQQQHSHLDRLSIDDFEVEEDVRVDFPCPYCFDDYDIASLCSHLEDEHPFEAKVTRRRRLRRVALSNNSALSLLGRDLREAHLQVLLGGGGLRSSSNNSSHIASDSFLSSLVLNLSAPEVEDISKSAICGVEDADAKNITPMQTWKPSLCSSLSSEEREQKTRQAGFVQDLLLSTLFGD
ncbi:hypothetical protein AMTRI_Chr01g112940 [Amborella trichopoda]